MPWPKNAGAEPTPPKFPQPSATRETSTPLPPSSLRSIARSYARRGRQIDPAREYALVSVSETEAHAEAQQQAAPVVAVALGLLILLAVVSEIEGWRLLDWLPWWAWLVLAIPEIVLIVDFAIRKAGVGGTRSRRLAIALLVLLVLGNVLALLVLVAGLITTSTKDLGGGELLLTAAVIWSTNVIVFGIWFWEVDLGGPVERAMRGHTRKAPDFEFPQDDNRDVMRAGWYPKLWDYLYVSLTNSIAFSPTDAMPLTRQAKALMGLESAISVVTVLLVAARAVNVLAA